MGKVPALAVQLLNCISLLSSLDERMKYGQHYLTRKNNVSFTNTNQFLKDYFIYFLVKVFSLSALFSQGSRVMSLKPANTANQLFLITTFQVCTKYTSYDSLHISFLLTASFSQSYITSLRQMIMFLCMYAAHEGIFQLIYSSWSKDHIITV